MYKVGDNAKVREDLVPNEVYGGVIFVRPMERYKKTGIIIGEAMNDGCYYDAEDGFCWSDEMLEPVEETEPCQKD